MTPLIAANWKMNGLGKDGKDRVRKLLSHVAANKHKCDIVVCPPATLLPSIACLLAGSPVALGGQDCHAAGSGAHTGDVSAPMLADVGCRHVIVGHSERRADHGETDTVVCSKAAAAHASGLTAIVCVGESESQRDGGETLAVVGGQLAGSLPHSVNAENTVVAYEPIWAIGTGRTPTLDEVSQVHEFIGERLCDAFPDDGDKVRVLYGGSVKPSNAADLLAIQGVNGALVGGASLNADDFWTICQSCP
jgi:triosephosphate isomerase